MRTKNLQSYYIKSPKLNQLCLLGQLAANPRITQAELANRCSLSAAMVNNYMKDLCNKGLIEYKRKSVKSVSYHLTPHGARHMALLQTERLGEMIEIYTEAKDHIRTRILDQASSALQRIVIYGSGHLAQLSFHALETSNIHVLGICDDDPEKVGRELCGCEILHSSKIRFMAPNAVIIADLRRSEEIFEKLEFLLNHGIEVIRLDKILESKPEPESRMHSLKTARKQQPAENIRASKADS